jgi:cellobiose transport system substrate-binding protein
MWYWNRSAAPGLLETAAEAIPDTDFHVRADLIGTNFDTKLRTSLAGGAYIPDVTWINSNNSLYYRNENQFVDMNELGAADLKDDYYEWKWNLGNTPEGRFCFFPLDIGPTGFYFRADIFDEAGLPSDPDEMSSAIDTWEKFFEVGEELKEQSGATMLSTASTVYDAILNASPDRYFDENDQPIFEVDGNSVRTAWDTAVAAIEAGVVSSLQTDSDKNAAWTSGKCAGNISAAWWAQILEEAAPDTSGNWRIADPPHLQGPGSHLRLHHLDQLSREPGQGLQRGPALPLGPGGLRERDHGVRR